ncbi:MAG: transglycosylase SLT domain-containing protein [Alphaproteobacteria bacterium]|nr:transglycosylase SLT domain-containing protein [Alphaproteobacteria bacterium]
MFKVFVLILCLLTWSAKADDGVLSSMDRDVYEQIFTHIENNELDSANELLSAVNNDVLKGYVLAKIYLTQGKSAKKQSLTNWFYKYHQLPIFNEVYDLALKIKAFSPYNRKPDKTQNLVAGYCNSMMIADPIDIVYMRHGSYVPEQFRKKVRRGLNMFSINIRRGKTLAAKLHLKEIKRHLSQRDLDDLNTALAFAYFIDRQDESAMKTLEEPLKRSLDRNPHAFWVAGLASFRLGNFEDAENYFKTLTTHPKAIATMRSASAFWVTRSLMRQKKFVEISKYLKQAAFTSPHSFYGLLAQRALGWEIGHTWKSANQEVNIDEILAVPGGKRMVALLEIGQLELAERELLTLYAERKDLRDDLRAYVEILDEYPELKEQMAGINGKIETPDGDNALYPVPNWKPLDGWKVDKALVYAFIRQESCFKTRALSKVGARGIMQLMPATAKLMARRLKIKYQKGNLYKIPYSLTIGQELIQTLLNYKTIQGNLLMAIASYNCGPRNTAKWQKRTDMMNDPVMFVEAIPSRETRGFVKKVTANYWIYRSLLGEDLSSIDAVLAGEYPIYMPEQEVPLLPLNEF